MRYKTLLHPKAAREFKALPPHFKERLKNQIHLLEEKLDREDLDIRYLKGTHDPRLYRLRVGDYRVIYRIDNEREEILVEKISQRKSVYR